MFCILILLFHQGLVTLFIYGITVSVASYRRSFKIDLIGLDKCIVVVHASYEAKSYKVVCNAVNGVVLLKCSLQKSVTSPSPSTTSKHPASSHFFASALVLKLSSVLLIKNDGLKRRFCFLPVHEHRL